MCQIRAKRNLERSVLGHNCANEDNVALRMNVRGPVCALNNENVAIFYLLSIQFIWFTLKIIEVLQNTSARPPTDTATFVRYTGLVCFAHETLRTFQQRKMMLKILEKRVNILLDLVVRPV